MELLSELAPLETADRILDLGGQIDEGSDGQLLETYPHPERLTAVNLTLEHVRRIRSQAAKVRVLAADACRLPFPDDAFDLVYSNAVIEHVGDWAAQQAMAREIMRVGRSWFITTPNRWFPFEFHTRLPLVSWLPADWMATAARIYSYNHVRGRYQSGIVDQIRLITARELGRLFPGSRILPVRVTIWPETLVAFGSKDP